MSQVALLVLAAFAAFLLSWAGCALMKRTGVVDAPDGERKLQAAPVPRLGGVGVMAAIGIVYAGAGLLHATSPALLGGDWLPGTVPAVWFALLASALFAFIGAADDIFGMGAVMKLVLILAVCIGAPLLGVVVPEFDSPFGSVTLPTILIAGSAAWLLVFSNAANFMDGSNGLSLGSMGVMFAGLGASLVLTDGIAFQPGLVVIMAAIAAFLIHNMRGELYAGDAGAFGIGGLFATLALISGLPVWTIATLGLPFLVDVLLTLISRTKRGEKLFVAHRDHAYQALIKAGWSHAEVAIVWWGLSAACAVAAAVGAVGGGALPFMLFWVFAILLSTGWLVIHRQAGNRIPGRADV